LLSIAIARDLNKSYAGFIGVNIDG